MSFKHIKPLGSRVLVKRSEAKKARGSIILPDSALEKPKQGEVVAVGPENLMTKVLCNPCILKWETRFFLLLMQEPK